MQIVNSIKEIFNTVLHIIQTISLVDVFDILIVSIILYYVYKFIRDKRAGKLAVGVVFMIAECAPCSIFSTTFSRLVFLRW